MRAGKGFTLVILNEDMNDIMKITKLLEHSGVISDGVTETTKLEIENQQGRFLGSHSISAISNFFSSKWHKCKMNWKSRKRIYR